MFLTKPNGKATAALTVHPFAVDHHLQCSLSADADKTLLNDLHRQRGKYDAPLRITATRFKNQQNSTFEFNRGLTSRFACHDYSFKICGVPRFGMGGYNKI